MEKIIKIIIIISKKYPILFGYIKKSHYLCIVNNKHKQLKKWERHLRQQI